LSATDLITHYVRTLVKTAQSAGWGADEICRKAGVNLEEVLEGSKQSTPEELAIIVVEVSKWDETLGQIPGSRLHGAWPLMCELVLNSNSLEEALDHGFRYFDHVLDEFKFELRAEGHRAFIEITLTNPDVDVEHLFKEWWPRMWHRFAGWLIGENIPLYSVSFVHKPVVRVAEYDEIFGCPCHFEQASSRLEFDARWLSRTIVREQQDLVEYLTVSRMDLVRLPGDESCLKQRIHYSLYQHFQRNQKFPYIEDMASECYVSSQTLRRRLQEEGTTYSRIKDEIRRKVVSEYLGDRDVPINEVSRLAGFAEPSGLTRAVKLWFGVSPRNYRKGLRSAASRASQNL
jgi:AraC-like DNA-binding protein